MKASEYLANAHPRNKIKRDPNPPPSRGRSQDWAKQTSGIGAPRVALAEMAGQPVANQGTARLQTPNRATNSQWIEFWNGQGPRPASNTYYDPRYHQIEPAAAWTQQGLYDGGTPPPDSLRASLDPRYGHTVPNRVLVKQRWIVPPKPEQFLRSWPRQGNDLTPWPGYPEGTEGVPVPGFQFPMTRAQQAERDAEKRKAQLFQYWGAQPPAEQPAQPAQQFQNWADATRFADPHVWVDHNAPQVFRPTLTDQYYQNLFGATYNFYDMLRSIPVDAHGEPLRLPPLYKPTLDDHQANTGRKQV